MATVLLGNLGTVLGGVFGPFGALLGRAAGSLAGAAIDSAIVSALSPTQKREGPRLTTSDIQASTEGSGISRIYGRARTTGQIIWATRFEEEITKERSGGKGASPKVETTTYSYYANVAIGLCEGPIAGIGRIWADGDELDQTLIEARLYCGTPDQAADPLILAKEGSAPAYRNLAYIVFEHLPIGNYGNRIPQFSVEVFRPVGQLERQLEGVAIIPGNEFGLSLRAVSDGNGETENRHDLTAETDFVAAIDRLVALAPNLKSVMLVVTWFGDDLRAGHCSIRPKTVSATKTTKPLIWRVAGLTRQTAQAVATLQDVPIYGGTPSDETVIEAIRHLKAKGLAVTLCPFIMMDIVAGNGRPDPHGGSEQPALPWRGRITCHPAPGRAGTPDGTASVAAEIAAFTGSAMASQFAVGPGSVSYQGPDDWGYRRFILHQAALAAAAGGVDSFLIGSEMPGLTFLRTQTRTYPFVATLVQLAADCRSLLGASTAIGYAADWSEWCNHRPSGQNGEVIFHLDPLWSSADVDFIGIDAYLPLSDWRDGSHHLDFSASGPVSIHDQAYLRDNVEGGEYFDWYYETIADRVSQTRRPIVDTSAAAEPWIFRNKDLRSWWENAHHDRPAGLRSPQSTSWVPRSKPIRLIEYGCPAVDKGANQPNLFPDPRSRENGLPWFSSGARDDGMQRSYLMALLGYWSDPSHNPVSPLYGRPMIDLARSHAWCFDTRPWPNFPMDTRWGDAANWQTGHWLSGRLGTAPAAETIGAILDDAQFADATIEPLPQGVDGVTTNGVQSPRALLDALRPVLSFEAVESDGKIRFRDRFQAAPLATISADTLVADEEGISAWRLTRAQETELPATIRISFGDPARQDQTGTVEARRAQSGSLVVTSIAPPAIMPAGQARKIVEQELAAAWTGREQLTVTLPPSLARLDPGDVFVFAPTGRLMQLTAVDDQMARRAEAREVDPPAGAGQASPEDIIPVVPRPQVKPPILTLVDGPLLRDDDLDHAGYLAATMSPFRSGVAAWRSPEASGFLIDTLIDLPAITGRTTGDFYSGPVWRFDRVNALYVRLDRGALQSLSEVQLLNGGNPLLIENADCEWELLQFGEAELIAPSAYRLSRLLRGQKGTEHAMRNPVAEGARILFVDAAVTQTGLSTSHLGLSLNWRAGPADRDISVAEPADSVTMRARARRPLSPVHLKARLLGGDVSFSWIRRSRISADSWDQTDVPLGEAAEGYELDIMKDGAVIRTIRCATPSALYSAAERAADGVTLPFSYSVQQMSQSFGRGIPAWSMFYG